MMMVPYMFHDALLDDWFQNDWDRDFDRMMQAAGWSLKQVLTAAIDLALGGGADCGEV